jgi:DNA-binding NarL/FixJ family response regulator
MADPVRPHSAKAAGRGRPKVLLVDDDASILKAISRTLAGDFDVVAAVPDGTQALHRATHLDPDLVVLDVSMPGLNGFQTAAELKRLGSRAPVVFLTMHQEDEFVAQAVRSGAMGYVLKTSAWSNLSPALGHALAGRQCLPFLTPLVMTNVDAHAVQFHADDSVWLDRVADVLSRALHRGDIVATVLLESNRDILALRMDERGWNPGDLEARGRYLVFDAEEAATQIMRDGRVHADAIAELVVTLERARTACPGGPRSHVTLVGEIAAVLCRRGNAAAALELESMWDEQTRSLPILTICAYPAGCLDHHPTPGLVSHISAHHAVISQDAGSGS